MCGILNSKYCMRPLFMSKFYLEREKTSLYLSSSRLLCGFPEKRLITMNAKLHGCQNMSSIME